MGSGAMLAGDPDDLDRVLERVRTAKAADIQRAAASLGASSRNVVWLLPEAQATGGGGSAGSP
jgi:hypothetical protein